MLWEHRKLKAYYFYLTNINKEPHMFQQIYQQILYRGSYKINKHV